MVHVVIRHRHRSPSGCRPARLVVQKDLSMEHPPVAGLVICHTEDGDRQHFVVEQVYYDSDSDVYVAEHYCTTPPDDMPLIVKGLSDGWYEVDL